jgi:homoserine kinase
MAMNEIKVFAPATVANVVCGFDIMGFALQEPCDVMTIRKTKETGIRIINADSYGLPTAPEKNVCGGALLAMMKEVDIDFGFEIISEKKIKPGSGIGSSAASAAAVVVGANELLGRPFTKMDLVRFATYGEEIASGARHADNIAPCIFGGVTIIRNTDPLDIIPITCPDMYVTIVHPQIEVKTSEARAMLKKEVLLTDAVTQWGNVAGLVAGFLLKDYDLIGRSLCDVIIEPVRSVLIPSFAEIKKQSMLAGALGGGISGSGPSVFMLSRDKATAQRVEQSICAVYDKIDLEYNTYVTTISHEGVRIQL